MSVTDFRKTYLSCLTEAKQGKIPINGEFPLELNSCRTGETKKKTRCVYRSQIIVNNEGDDFFGRQVNDAIYYESSDFGLQTLIEWLTLCGVELPEEVMGIPAEEFSDYFSELLESVCEDLSSQTPRIRYMARITTDDYGPKATVYELLQEEQEPDENLEPSVQPGPPAKKKRRTKAEMAAARAAAENATIYTTPEKEVEEDSGPLEGEEKEMEAPVVEEKEDFVEEIEDDDAKTEIVVAFAAIGVILDTEKTIIELRENLQEEIKAGEHTTVDFNELSSNKETKTLLIKYGFDFIWGKKVGKNIVKKNKAKEKLKVVKLLAEKGFDDPCGEMTIKEIKEQLQTEIEAGDWDPFTDNTETEKVPYNAESFGFTNEEKAFLALHGFEFIWTQR